MDLSGLSGFEQHICFQQTENCLEYFTEQTQEAGAANVFSSLNPDFLCLVMGCECNKPSALIAPISKFLHRMRNIYQEENCWIS